MLKIQISDLNSEKTKFENNITNLMAELESLKNQQSDQTNNLNDEESKRLAVIEQFDIEMNNLKLNHTTEKTELNNMITQLKIELENLKLLQEKELKEITKQSLTERESDRDNFESVIAIAKKDESAIHEGILSNVKETYEKEISELKSKIVELSDKSVSLEAEIVAWQIKYDDTVLSNTKLLEQTKQDKEIKLLDLQNNYEMSMKESIEKAINETKILFNRQQEVEIQSLTKQLENDKNQAILLLKEANDAANKNKEQTMLTMFKTQSENAINKIKTELEISRKNQEESMILKFEEEKKTLIAEENRKLKLACDEAILVVCEENKTKREEEIKELIRVRDLKEQEIVREGNVRVREVEVEKDRLVVELQTVEVR